MIALSVAEAVILVILIFLRTRLRIAIALLKEGSKSVSIICVINCVLELKKYLIFPFFRAIGYIMSTLFYPIITFVLLAICISYWAVTAMYPPVCILKIIHR